MPGGQILIAAQEAGKGLVRPVHCCLRGRQNFDNFDSIGHGA